ncbi:hypothetical protein HRbin41_01469 [bacterium HR41]|nr:hypothetical protein HRbin41_01469 [bacterium HR41]
MRVGSERARRVGKRVEPRAGGKRRAGALETLAGALPVGVGNGRKLGR